VPNTDPEKRRAYQREYIRRNYERHLEHSKLAMRRWRANNPAARLARDRAYKKRHKDQVNAGSKRHRLRYPEQRRAISQRRRARELGATGNFTHTEWMALLEEYEYRCGYCGDGGPMQADHRVPLSRGGTHDITNILPACRRCNVEKATTSEFEFRTRLANESKKHRKIDGEAAG
jgi:5-methylcytosine-specific restriction endonuclease McrA